MHAIARELNLSETAFVVKGCDRPILNSLFSHRRWRFRCADTRHSRLPKCCLKRRVWKSIQFTTGDQLRLSIRSVGELIEMEFPVYDLQAASAPESLLQALGIKAIEFCGYNEETKILMLVISKTSALADLHPDFHALVKSHDSINGVLVTARADDGFDFHSRYFWPWSGTNEDPVTGGTHTFLAKYWGDRLGKSIMKSFQSSQRSGQMEVELAENNKLLIRGNAVIVIEGSLKV